MTLRTILILVVVLVAHSVSAATENSGKSKSLPKKQISRPIDGENTEYLVESAMGIRFVLLKGGRFRMGDTFKEGEKDESPVHEVQLSDFAIGEFAVTKRQFRLFVNATGYRTDAEKGDGCYVEKNDLWNYDPATSWRNPGFYQDENHPVVCVSWNDATVFSEWLSKKSGRQYRLPTEAEWEYAARSGGRQERFAGFSDPKQFYRYGNFCDKNCSAEWQNADQNDNYKYTAPVGKFLHNGIGLYDMVGNVWQWVSDYYDERYYRESTRKLPLDGLYGGEQRRGKAGNNPQGPQDGRYRALRGGSWNSALFDARVSQRLRNKPEYRRSYIGFRLAVSLK